jgi:hypothetical protein
MCSLPAERSSFLLLPTIFAMASDIPQIAVVGVPEDNNHSTLITRVFCHSSSPISKSGRNSLDAFSSPTSHAPDTSTPPQPPPFPTPSAHSSGSIRFATWTVLRENNPEEHDGLSPLVPNRHRSKGSVTTVASVGSHGSSTRDVEDRTSPLSPAQIARGCELPSESQHTHSDAASSDVSSRSSSPALLKKTLHRVRRPSPTPTSETDTNSDTTLDGLLRGLGTQHNHDLSALSTKRGMLPSHPADSASQGSGGPPPPVEKKPSRPNIMVTSLDVVPQGMQSMSSLGVSVPPRSSESVYERVFQKPRAPPKLEVAPTISAGPHFAFAVDPVHAHFASVSGGQMSGLSFSAANAARFNTKRVWCIFRSILGF